MQGTHISNQSVIYAFAGDARSRVTTIYLTSYFIGGALGSFAASVAFGADGWRGVCVAGALIALWVASGSAHDRRRSNATPAGRTQAVAGSRRISASSRRCSRSSRREWGSG
ncbi:hypothetical protein WJ89_13770 [Burkholderia ubonensis]|nr:hypothetical protein WJ89_13770 [Burkholderia ubonensis]KVQ76142.1 hypothetical protein WK06_20850 [Burkholderia ubonensis]KVR09125.1 hypothetical protein WK12_21055 [Burkholderia ubonensis]KWD29721.1 hypothetical protein WL63_26380 [Burkholderia ubonensis]KWD48283.1 hypothetical protein WL64_29750 [Burkholderia ubonensis]